MASYDEELDRSRVPTDAITDYRSMNPSVSSPAVPPNFISTSHNDGITKMIYEGGGGQHQAGSAFDKRSEDLLTSDGGRLPGGLARQGGDRAMGIISSITN